MTRIASDYLYDSLVLGYIDSIELQNNDDYEDNDVIFFNNNTLKVCLAAKKDLTKEEFYYLIHKVHHKDMFIKMN